MLLIGQPCYVLTTVVSNWLIKGILRNLSAGVRLFCDFVIQRTRVKLLIIPQTFKPLHTPITTNPIPASFEQTQRVPTGHPNVCLCDVSGATNEFEFEFDLALVLPKFGHLPFRIFR